MNDEPKPESVTPGSVPAENTDGGADPARDTSGAQEPGPDKLRVDLEEALKSAQAYKDQFLRKAAEFENFKRRSETEYLNTVRNANEILIGALLPIVEDFTRSLKAGVNGGEGEAFYRGVELIYQKLMKVLEGQGLAPFESSGKPFDVDYHDALLQVPRDDVPPGTVIEEISRGYTLNDRVLRHAKVVVSAAAQPESAPEGSPTDGGSKESTGH